MRGKISLPVFYRKKVFLETSSGVVVCSSSNRFHVYDQVLLDGIYLAYRWCLITATNWEKIIAWQWCQRENSAAYQALMNRLLAPGGQIEHRKSVGNLLVKESRFQPPMTRSARPATTQPSTMTPPIKTVRYTFAKSGPDDKTSRDTPGRAPHLATYSLFE